MADAPATQLSQSTRVFLDVMRDARRHGWRPTEAGTRRAGAFQWTDGRITVWLRVVPSGATLTIRQRMKGVHVIIARCEVGAWQTALDILAAYHVIGKQHSSAYRLALLEHRRRLLDA